MANFKISDKSAGTPTTATKILASTSAVVHAPTTLQILALESAYAIAKITVDTAIATATETEITWTTQEADSAAVWDPALPKRMTAPVAGLYLLNGGIAWASNVTGIRVARFWKGGLASGTRVGSEDRRDGSAAAGPSLTPSGTVVLAAGDYVVMTAYQNSGGNLNLIAATERCYFSMTLLNRTA